MSGTPEASASTFACHRCGACCTDLRERGTPSGFAELAPGVYRRASDGGLRLFAWEARAFPAEQLEPALVVADRGGPQVVLSAELQADRCPHFDADPATCAIYEDRPLVCRAFPLLVEPGEEGLDVAASAVCGARVPLAEMDEGAREAALARAYPQAWAPALAIPQVLRWLVHLVSFLETAGAIEPEPGLGPAELDDRPTVSLTERLEEAAIVDPEELAARAERIVARVRES